MPYTSYFLLKFCLVKFLFLSILWLFSHDSFGMQDTNVIPWRTYHQQNPRNKLSLIDDLVHERHNSIANALELRLSYSNPSKCESKHKSFFHENTYKNVVCKMSAILRADSMFAPSQWETSLQSNTVSHRLGANPESALHSVETWACFLSLARSKFRLCSANHRPGYWSNLPCDWLSIAWAYPEQQTENRPWACYFPYRCYQLTFPRVTSSYVHPNTAIRSSCPSRALDEIISNIELINFKMLK